MLLDTGRRLSTLAPRGRTCLLGGSAGARTGVVSPGHSDRGCERAWAALAHVYLAYTLGFATNLCYNPRVPHRDARPTVGTQAIFGDAHDEPFLHTSCPVGRGGARTRCVCRQPNTDGHTTSYHHAIALPFWIRTLCGRRPGILSLLPRRLAGNNAPGP